MSEKNEKATEKGLKPVKTAAELLDMFYLDARCNLLETAAFLDRLERVGGENTAISTDPRMEKLKKAITILSDDEKKKAERFLNLFSES